MERLSVVGTVCLCASLLAGCATIGDLEQENDRLRARVDSLENMNTQCAQQRDAIAGRVQQLEQENARLQNEQGELTRRLADTHALPPTTVAPSSQPVTATLPAPPPRQNARAKPSTAPSSASDAQRRTPPRVAAPPTPDVTRRNETDSTPPPVTAGDTDAGAEQNDQPSGRDGTDDPDAASGRPDAAGSSAAAQQPPAEESFLAAYQDALSTFKKGRYAAAEQQFTALVEGQVPADMEDNCNYWLGECLYAQKKYGPATDRFNLVLAVRRSDKTEAALMMQGNAFLALGDKARARRDFKRIVAEFPNGAYVHQAQKKLRRLR